MLFTGCSPEPICTDGEQYCEEETGRLETCTNGEWKSIYCTEICKYDKKIHKYYCTEDRKNKTDQTDDEPDPVTCDDNALKCNEENPKQLLICHNNSWELNETCDCGCIEDDDSVSCQEKVESADSAKQCPETCFDEKTKCQGNAIWICKNGQWQHQKTCSNGCIMNFSAECASDDTPDEKCTENDRKCADDGVTIMICKNETWIHSRPVCEYACDKGECINKPACTGNECNNPACTGDECNIPKETCPENEEKCSEDGKSLLLCLANQWYEEKNCDCVDNKCTVPVDPDSEVIAIDSNEITIFHDSNQKITATYWKNNQPVEHQNLQLTMTTAGCFKIENNQVTTGSDGTISITITAEKTSSDCTGELTISNVSNPSISSSVTIHVVGTDDNNNHMYDFFEDAPKQGTSCHSHNDCAVPGQAGFCDSFIGYQCSTPCTESIHCLDGFYCRDDGRCAPEVFETVWNIPATNAFPLPTIVASNCDFIVDWGDGQTQHVGNDVCGKSHLTHPYPQAGTYHIKITGTYDGWRMCSDATDCANVEAKNCISTISWLKEVVSFGPVGLGRYAFGGTTLNKLSSVDIPDASKLVTMQDMFCHSGSNLNIENWDVSNVTNMNETFTHTKFFNSPLNRWDVSKVTTMIGTFALTSAFNQPIDSWNTSNVTNMYRCFYGAAAFNQDISSWDYSRVTNFSDMVTGSAFASNKSLLCKLKQNTTSATLRALLANLQC